MRRGLVDVGCPGPGVTSVRGVGRRAVQRRAVLNGSAHARRGRGGETVRGRSLQAPVHDSTLRRPTMFRQLRTPALALLVTTLAAASVHAQQLTRRADLLDVLGAGAVTEDFEDVAFPTWVKAYGSGIPRIDANTDLPGLAAGAIAPGLAFANANGTHWFYQPTAEVSHLGLASKAYAAGHWVNDMLLLGGSRAVGFDLMEFASVSGSPVGSIRFYGADDRLLGSIDGARLVHGSYTFFGWQSAGADIARVRFDGFSPYGSTGPKIDNVTFAAASTAPVVTPEPTTVALCGAGLAALAGMARRRRTTG